VTSALEVIFYNNMRYINLRFTYLLTYCWKNRPCSPNVRWFIPMELCRRQHSYDAALR